MNKNADGQEESGNKKPKKARGSQEEAGMEQKRPRRGKRVEASDIAAEALTDRQHTRLSQILNEALQHERAEISRLAHDVGVTENTIYRWMNGSSQPRINHFKRLLTALPDYAQQLMAISENQYPDLLEKSPIAVPDIQKDIYERVIDLIVASEEPETRLWQVAQAIFEYGLLQLDSRRQGLTIIYSPLMPARTDHIHSLRDQITRGNPPWPYESDAKIFLGSSSLAGAAIKSQRTQIWHIASDRQPAEIGEHERSSCCVPISRGGRFTAGVLTVSSVQPDFFSNIKHQEAVEAYAKLLSLALPENAYQPLALVQLHPMPSWKIQRTFILREYVPRVLTFARVYNCSRRAAERQVQSQMELEFEALVYSKSNKKSGLP